MAPMDLGVPKFMWDTHSPPSPSLVCDCQMSFSWAEILRKRNNYFLEYTILLSEHGQNEDIKKLVK